jgi:hypothetical protein
LREEAVAKFSVGRSQRLQQQGFSQDFIKHNADLPLLFFVNEAKVHWISVLSLYRGSHCALSVKSTQVIQAAHSDLSHQANTELAFGGGLKEHPRRHPQNPCNIQHLDNVDATLPGLYGGDRGLRHSQ